MSVTTGENSKSRSLESTSKPPAIEESDCIFDDSACGEALLAQRVTLDFTPNEDVDNDFVQRKCVAFWDFINSQPELTNLCSDQYEYSDVSDVSKSKRNEQSDFISPEPNIEYSQEKTAVSMLDFVEEKGLIDRTFEAKLPKLYCEIDLTSYSNDTAGTSKDTLTFQSTSNKNLKKLKQSKRADNQSLPKLSKMCKKLQKWDANHPKSMDPPGPAPVLAEDIRLI